MTRRSPKPLRKRLRSLYNWHRWLGVASALFIVWLSITGIALEHSQQLGLDQKPITSAWLLQGFGVSIDPPSSALRIDDDWLSQVDGRLYLNQKMIDRGPAAVGFSHLGLLWAVATRETLWLLNDQAEVLEKIEGLDLPGRIIALGKADNGLLIETKRGNYLADPLSANWPEWQPSTQAVLAGYQSAPLPTALKTELVRQAQQYALNWENILLEAHSGRLFGKYGVLLMDTMAVIFIVLGATGISMWIRYLRAARKRRIKLGLN